MVSLFFRPNAYQCTLFLFFPLLLPYMLKFVDDEVRSFDNDYPRRQPHSITNNAHYSVEMPISSLSQRLPLPPPISTLFFSSLLLFWVLR